MLLHASSLPCWGATGSTRLAVQWRPTAAAMGCNRAGKQRWLGGAFAGKVAALTQARTQAPAMTEDC